MNAKDYHAMNLVSHVSIIKETNVITLIVLNYLSNSNSMRITVSEVKIILAKMSIN